MAADLQSDPPEKDFARRRSILLAMAGMGVVGSSNSATASAEDPIAAFINGYIKRHNFPGAALAISKNGRIFYKRGFGFSDIAAHARPDPAVTLFRIASVSKPITAIALFKLLESSATDIDTQLNRVVFGSAGYLPEYTEILDPRVLKITLRDLLQHTAGWDSSLGYDPQYDVFNIAKIMGAPAPADAVTVIRYMLKFKPLDNAPGIAFHYSNLGYNVVGRIVEKLSGQSYEQYVQSMVSAIGIGDMHIAGNRLSDRLQNEARYYEDPRVPEVLSIYDGVTKVPESYGGLAFHTMDAHGGWLATPVDLVRIAEAVTPGAAGVQLLNAKTIGLMAAPVTTIGNPTASLGWVSTDQGATLSHGGALTTGTFSYLSRRSDGIVWAILFNRLPVAEMTDIGALSSELLTGMGSRLDGISSRT